MILFFILQSADDLQKVISTDNATVQGLLLGGCVIFGFATVYLYKENRKMTNERIAELKENTHDVIQVNKSYADFVTNFEKYNIHKNV